MAETIHIKGAEQLSKKLRGKASTMKSFLFHTTTEATLYVWNQVPDYPPPISTSSYVRTGTLGREITNDVKTLGSTVVGTIGTDTKYAPWVISTELVGTRGPQASVHQNRWFTLQGVVRKARDAVIRIYEDAIREFLR